jgi:hypothetical protein
MRIPKDVILIWTGLNSNIPSGWTRETSLDDKYPKAWGNESPNVTGGSATHSHTASDPGHSLIDHTHTYTTSTFNPTNQYVTKAWEANYPNYNYHYPHSHTGTTGSINGGGLQSVNFTTGEASNDPPFKKVIFIKAGNSSILQDGICVLWDKTTTPNNYTDENYNGKFIKGAGSGEDAGGEGGSLNHSHSVNHSQTISPHSHQGSWTNTAPENPPSGGDVFGRTPINNWTTYIHKHWADYGNDNTAGQPSYFTGTYHTTENVEPYHIKLRLLKKLTGGIKEKGIIGLWLGNTNDIPKGWVLCDGQNGTLDLRDKFIKITTNPSEIGQVGGSNTHSHASYSHTHPAISHTHSISTGYADSNTYEPAWSGYNTTPKNHTHTGTTNATNMTFTNSSITFSTSANQPPYRTVAYIQFQKEIYGGSALLNFI